MPKVSLGCEAKGPEGYRLVILNEETFSGGLALEEILDSQDMCVPDVVDVGNIPKITAISNDK